MAAETALQKKNDIQDSKDDLYRYFMNYSSYRCRPELIRALVRTAAPPTLNGWRSTVSCRPRKSTHTERQPCPGVHQNEGMGGQYVNTMKERAEALGAQILLKTGAKELMIENGNVSGSPGTNG